MIRVKVFLEEKNLETKKLRTFICYKQVSHAYIVPNLEKHLSDN